MHFIHNLFGIEIQYFSCVFLCLIPDFMLVWSGFIINCQQRMMLIIVLYDFWCFSFTSYFVVKIVNNLIIFVEKRHACERKERLNKCKDKESDSCRVKKQLERFLAHFNKFLKNVIFCLLCCVSCCSCIIYCVLFKSRIWEDRGKWKAEEGSVWISAFWTTTSVKSLLNTRTAPQSVIITGPRKRPAPQDSGRWRLSELRSRIWTSFFCKLSLWCSMSSDAKCP